ncbi:MAG: MBL fold metallo-hydrolase [Eudoraea sp.]|nr:MBL fold metallo-hydrolase [Eudoraea sp.]
MRLIVLLFCTIFLCSCRVERSDRFRSLNFELVELGEGVYSCIHKFGGKAICNVGIVDNGEETIIFDSFLSPDVAKELLEALKEMDLSPLKYVVNSHSHNDHIRGNQVFPNEVKIISTTRTSELIEKWEPLDIIEEQKFAPDRYSYYDSLYNSFKGDKLSREYQQILMWRPYYETLSNSHIEVKTRLPDIFVDSVQNFEGPNRRIQLLSKGQGHTESDLILYLPDDEILFTGDLIFNECHPYVPHGSISKWKDWLDFMNSLDIQTIMPGHGDIGTKDLVDHMKNYLTNLEISARNIYLKGQAIEDIESIEIPAKYKEWWFDRFYGTNLRFAYEVHEKEKVQ